MTEDTKHKRRIRLIKYFAHRWYQIRKHHGAGGSEKGDWDMGARYVDAQYPRLKLRGE